MRRGYQVVCSVEEAAWLVQLCRRGAFGGVGLLMASWPPHSAPALVRQCGLALGVASCLVGVPHERAEMIVLDQGGVQDFVEITTGCACDTFVRLQRIAGLQLDPASDCWPVR